MDYFVEKILILFSPYSIWLKNEKWLYFSVHTKVAYVLWDNKLLQTVISLWTLLYEKESLNQLWDSRILFSSHHRKLMTGESCVLNSFKVY